MKQIALLTYESFPTIGYIPRKEFERFKEEYKDCIILEEKQGKWIVRLRALQIEKCDLEKLHGKKIVGDDEK